MMKDELQRLLSSDPFRPIRVSMVNGAVIEIADARVVTLGDETARVLRPNEDWVAFAYSAVCAIERYVPGFRGTFADYKRLAPRRAR
ncbi:MAG TPA: hypothetical protein VEA69_11945 [Tepidisphaeraceae bacterium]|nr:hypothetical protein [Tepidisphaeraceae bacterium]